MLALIFEVVIFILGISGILIFLAVHDTDEPRYAFLISAGILIMLVGLLSLWYAIVFCPCTYEFGNTTMSNTEQPPYVTITNTSIYTCCVYSPIFPGNYTVDEEIVLEGEAVIPSPSSTQQAFGIFMVLIGLYAFLAGLTTPIMAQEENREE